MSTWIILCLALSLTAIAVIAFLKTPFELRFTRIPRSLEERVATYPPEAQAVILRGDKRRALLRSSPLIILGAILFGLGEWTGKQPHPECVNLLGSNLAHIALLFLCYGLPLILVFATAMEFKTGLAAVKTGYFPPLDAIVFNDTIAKRGALSRARGAAIVAMPFVMLGLLYVGHVGYMQLTGGKTAQEFDRKLQADCP